MGRHALNPGKKRRTRLRPAVRLVLLLLLCAAVAGSALLLRSCGVFSGGAPTGSEPPQTGNRIAQEALQMPDWVVQDFVPVNEFSRPGTPIDPRINGIVVHYVGNPGTTAEQNRSYYEQLAKLRNRYASSHFLIGMDGAVIQCVPLDEIAFASSQRNHDTISIECCHPGEDGAFTDATYQALLRLVRWLCDTYGLNAGDVIRHYDVTGKECPRYFVRHPEAWDAFRRDLDRGDPGEATAK